LFILSLFDYAGMEGGIMEADKGQGEEDAVDEGCSRVMED
jgi:hypothetical protein